MASQVSPVSPHANKATARLRRVAAASASAFFHAHPAAAAAARAAGDDARARLFEADAGEFGPMVDEVGKRRGGRMKGMRDAALRGAACAVGPGRAGRADAEVTLVRRLRGGERQRCGPARPPPAPRHAGAVARRPRAVPSRRPGTTLPVRPRPQTMATGGRRRGNGRSGAASRRGAACARDAAPPAAAALDLLERGLLGGRTPPARPHVWPGQGSLSRSAGGRPRSGPGRERADTPRPAPAASPLASSSTSSATGPRTTTACNSSPCSTRSTPRPGRWRWPGPRR